MVGAQRTQRQCLFEESDLLWRVHNSTYAEIGACGVDEGQEMCKGDQNFEGGFQKRKIDMLFTAHEHTTGVGNRVETNVVGSATNDV